MTATEREVDARLDDCQRIQAVLSSRGHERSVDECCWYWLLYSDSIGAYWKRLPADSERIWDLVQSFLYSDFIGKGNIFPAGE